MVFYRSGGSLFPFAQFNCFIGDYSVTCAGTLNKLTLLWVEDRDASVYVHITWLVKRNPADALACVSRVGLTASIICRRSRLMSVDSQFNSVVFPINNRRCCRQYHCRPSPCTLFHWTVHPIASRRPLFVDAGLSRCCCCCCGCLAG